MRGRADMEGRFRGATKLKGIKDFAAKDYGLVPIRLDTWGQFVFILADPSRCSWQGPVAALSHTTNEKRKVIYSAQTKFSSQTSTFARV
jgi:hypothetical protein